MRSTLLFLSLVFLGLALLLVGCQNPVESDPATVDELPPVDLAAVTQIYEGVIPPFICGDEVISTMMTGKNRTSGAIKIANDNDFLYVAFEADPEYDIISSHLAVVRSLRDVPKGSEGEPAPGKFVLKRLNNKGTLSHTYKIPLAALYVDVGRDCGNTRLFILGHAVVKKKDNTEDEEAVWASGKRWVFPSSWASYQFYKIQCSEAPPPPQEISCQPSWAFGNRTFIDAGISADLGWFESYTQGGTVTRDIIGAFENNDPATGTVVGVMTLDMVRGPTSASITITLEMNDNFSMNSVGTFFNVLPPRTSDPTQWNYLGNLGGVKTYTTTYSLTGAVGSMPFYISAYTEACGPF